MSRVLRLDNKPNSATVDETPCENRQKHLTSLKGSGPWRNCRKCHLERDRMMTTGRAMMSVVFTDIWPDFGEDALSHAVAAPKSRPRGSKTKKKMRKILKETLCQIPSDCIMMELAESQAERCPDQNRHLQKYDGKWLWEDCAQCLHSRELMRQALLSHFSVGDKALSGLMMLQGSAAAGDESLPKDDAPGYAADHDLVATGVTDTPRDELTAEERVAIDVTLGDTYPGQPLPDDGLALEQPSADLCLDMPTAEDCTIREDYAVLTPTEIDPEYCAFAEVKVEAPKADDIGIGAPAAATASCTEQVEEIWGSDEENDYFYADAVREAITTRRWDLLYQHLRDKYRGAETRTE